MTTEENTVYEAKLRQLQQQLLDLEFTADDAQQPVELDQASMGRLTRMDAMQGQAMAQETARRRKRQLEKIDGALRRMASNNFGYCYICDRDIEPKRLAADPTITRCMACLEVKS